MSLRDGYVFLDRIDWDNFNESGDLKAQVEAFKEATGAYPESVHVDRIYRTRENRAWCKENTFLVINLSTLLRQVFAFFVLPTLITSFSGLIITPSYDWRNSQQQELIIL